MMDLCKSNKMKKESSKKSDLWVTLNMIKHFHAKTTVGLRYCMRGITWYRLMLPGRGHFPGYYTLALDNFCNDYSLISI